MNTEKTIRPKAPVGAEPSERGQVLQWRPRTSAADRDYDYDVDFFEFPHEAPSTDSVTSRIFAAERRPLEVKQARTLPTTV